MTLTKCFSTVAALSLLLGTHATSADSIKLKNGDQIRGDVVSLDGKTLTIRSENFGEMEIPRSKVDVIGFGDQPLAERFPSKPQTPPTSPGGGSLGSGSMPSLQSPEVQAQLGPLLQQAFGGGGFGGLGNLQRNNQDTAEGLRELQQDLGPGPSADALDGYIKMFEMFGGGNRGNNSAGDGSPTPPDSQSPQSK